LAGGQLVLEQAQCMILLPIDKLTRSDFFPDVIGMEEHFAFGHLFCLLHAYSTG